MFANIFGNNSNCVCGLVWVCPKSHKYLPIPLKSVSITASVVHAVAQVEITQVYENSEWNPIEATYIFPLDSNGAVTHFHAELNGKIIKGVVKSTKDAQKDYDNAIRQQKTAFLGEEIKADVFQLKVGFLKPGARAKVVIGYVAEVKNDPDSHAIRFIIPTTVAPRYIPASSTTNLKKIRDLANMKFSSDAPAPISIKVVASIQGKIKSVTSLSAHKILIESNTVVLGNWNKVVVALAGTVTEMDRDFVLLVTPAEAVMYPRLYYEVSHSGSVAAMAHLIPSFALKNEAKVELVILVDRSASMDGNSIRMASAALQLFVHSLPPNCCFNIVGFGSGYDSLFPGGSCDYNQQTLLRAEQYAKSLKADFGGTEILGPLQAIYSQPHPRGYLRQIFVITDGEVSNTEEVIGLVKRNAHNSRVFALGIGASSSRHLVQGIASAGGGTCAFVEGDDSIQRATLSQLKNALQPALTDVRIEWLGLQRVELNRAKTLFGYNKPLNPTQNWGGKDEEFSQAPKIVPPIFDGNQMVVFGVFPPSLGKPDGVKITASTPDGPLSLKIQMNENNNLGRTEMLHKLAVIKLIREMELEESGIHQNSTCFQDEIVALGIEHGITSKYTSFIAVDDSDQEVTWNGMTMKTRQVPSQLPSQSPISSRSPLLLQRRASMSARMQHPSPVRSHGRMMRACHRSMDVPDEDSEHVSFCRMEVAEPSPSYPCRRSMPVTDEVEDCHWKDAFDLCDDRDDEETPQLHHHQQQQSVGRMAHRRAGRSSAAMFSVSRVRTRGDRAREIINHQNFDGSFPLSEALCGILDIFYGDIISEAAKKGWDSTVWATALAIACLTTTDLKEEKDLWELAVNKGVKWLMQNCTGKNGNILQEIRGRAMNIFAVL